MDENREQEVTGGNPHEGEDMRNKVLEALKARFQSYDDLVEGVEESQLGARVDVPRHKSLGEHLWCVVGARESYAKAIKAGTWQGFECSMTEYTTSTFIGKLRASADQVMDEAADVSDWTGEREKLLLDMAEHEAMHEGGIIRHMYALGWEIPDSVKWA